MPSVYNAMDIVNSSSSFCEGFPNVIGEAMASETKNNRFKRHYN
jgi:glycosyltransferase involved in cell wall biosynthesis